MKFSIDTKNPRIRFTRKSLVAAAISTGIALTLAPGVHAGTEWESGTRQNSNNETWYDDFFDESDSSRDTSTTGTNQTDYNTRNLPAVGSTYYTPYYYYWDPLIVGWTTKSPSEQSDQQQTQNRSERQQAATQDRGQNNRQAGRSGQDRDQESEYTTRPQQQHEQQQKHNARFEGKIDGYRQINLSTRDGKEEQHSFVRIRLRDGSSRIVSLGTNVEPSDLDLKKGEKISVSGRTARVDGRQVLIANRIETSDKTFSVKNTNQVKGREDRTDTSRDQSNRDQTDRDQSNRDQSNRDQSNRDQSNRDQDMSKSGNTVSVEGKITNIRQVRLGGPRNQNLIVRLELKNGNSPLIDLGKGTDLNDLNIKDGDQIRVEGKRVKIEGDWLIMAERIRVDGEKQKLQDRGDKEDRDENSYTSIPTIGNAGASGHHPAGGPKIASGDSE